MEEKEFDKLNNEEINRTFRFNISRTYMYER